MTFDSRKQNPSFLTEDVYYIPSMLPIHSFSLEKPGIFLVQSQPFPSYPSSSQIPQIQELLRRQNPYDSTQNKTETQFQVEPEIVSPKFAPYTVRPRTGPNQSDITCVIGTHLAVGYDISSIPEDLKSLLSYMCPFYNIPLQPTDVIIFGRRLTDVHILMKEQHVSGQQFIFKFLLHPCRLVIQNHGNQIIQINNMSGTESITLERSQEYEFKQDDDVWLTIWGIEKVMWRITVDGVFRDMDSVPMITFENKYFNNEMYTNALQKKDSLLPLPLPGLNSYTPSPFNYIKEQFGYNN